MNYNGSTQTVGNYNYYHLTVSGSNTKTLQNGVSIGGNLNIGDETTLDIGSNSLTVTGTTTIGGGSSGNLLISGYNTTSGVQTGQLSCTLNIPSAAAATTALFNIRTTFYVLFATRNK